MPDFETNETLPPEAWPQTGDTFLGFHLEQELGRGGFARVFLATEPALGNRAVAVREAGRCLVMQAKMAGRKLTMVFLDSAGKYSRIGDAERVRRWVSELPASVPTSMPVETTTSALGKAES